MGLITKTTLIIVAIVTSVRSAEVSSLRSAGASTPYSGFLRAQTFSNPDLESKLMAARFAPYQLFPLAWYDLPDDGYCFRLSHVHSASSAPTTRGIVIELRGHRGLPAALLAEVDHTGVKWTTKMVPASNGDEILTLVQQARLLAPPGRDLPRYISAFNFYLEVRVGQQYQYIWRQAPSDDTASRGIEGFLAVVKRLVELAEVPGSEVFYGESQRAK